MRALKSILVRLGMVLVLLGFFFAALEIVFRLAGRFQQDTSKAFYDRSETIYYPQDSRLHPWSAGASNVLQIAVIGDSITIGQGVQFDDTYGCRLERLLNLNTGVPPAEVRIYARGGLSTFMEVHALKMALKNQPTLVLLGLCHNDTEDFLRRDEIDRWREAMLPRVPGPALAAALRRSRVLAWVYQKIENERCKKARLTYYRRIYDVHYSGWKRFRHALRDFRELTAAAGVRLLVVIFPIVNDLDRDPLAFTHRQLRQALEEEGLDYLDLLEVYGNKSPLRMHAVPYVDGHPSEIAHRMAAEAIFECLLGRGYVDPAYLPQGMKESREGYWQWIQTRMSAPHLQTENAPPPDDDVPADGR